jgi:hypothetical protein
MHGVGRVERSGGTIARPSVKIEFLAGAGWRIPGKCTYEHKRKSSNTEQSHERLI